MPHQEALIAKGNGLLTRENIGRLKDLEFPVTEDVSDEIFVELGLATPEELENLRRWPQGIRTALRASLYSAIHRDPEPVPVTLCWTPAYDYQISVFEARGTTGTTMTIQLSGPYEKVYPAVQ